MNKKSLLIVTAIILLLAGLVYGASKVMKKDPLANVNVVQPFEGQFSPPLEPKPGSQDTFLPQDVYAIKLHEGMNFAGEPMPLNDWEVRERMEREMLVNVYWHSNTIQLLKLGHRYFPEIEKILKANGVPDDFKYLALAESGLRNVISPSSAVGYWQFMRETGIKYGLEVNDNVDERYDYAKSTQAACVYLKEAYGKLGNWTMAAASYNMGITGISSEANFQKTNNYYNLWLNTETSRYIFRLAALKEVYEHADRYGFYLDKEDLYDPVPFGTVSVDSSITDLVGFAQGYGTNYKMIKVLNPWIKGHSLVNKSNKTYEIRIPLQKKM
jgi:hypothetical protein